MTEVVRFTVRTTHPWSPPGWLWVVLYDDEASLQAAAGAYNGREDHTHTAACFQGAPLGVHLDDDGMVDEPAARYAGVLRLTTAHGVATVAHEATHAACAMYLRQHAGHLDLTAPDSMDHEEVLAYAVGDILGGVVAGLIERGHW